MGLGDFVKGVGSAVGNVAKGAAYVANPTHLDDIAEGVGKVGSYVAKHPGQTWDTGFEVGRAVVKDQLKPQNLLINAALIGATVATGGLAGGALAAKVGLATRSVEAGLEGAKIAETAGTAFKGLEAATSASRSARFLTDLKGVGTGIKEAQGLAKADKVLGAVTEVRGAAREAVGLSRYGTIAAKRAEMAENVASKGGLLGKTSGLVAGSNNSAVQAENVYSSAARMRTRYNQVTHALDTPARMKAANQGVETMADPQAAIHAKASEEINKRTSSGVGYTPTSTQTGNSFAPLSQPQAQTPYAVSATPLTSGPPLANIAPLGSGGGAKPAVGRSKGAFSSGSLSQPTLKPHTMADTYMGQQPSGSSVYPTMQTQNEEPRDQWAPVLNAPTTLVGGSRTQRRQAGYSAPGMGKSVAGSMGATLGV